MRLQIKICGLTNVEDALAAADMGADYLGFVVYSKSPRGIASGHLRQIVDQVRGRARAVAVFVNASRADVEGIAIECGLHAVQVHGDEDAAEFSGMPVAVWRAVRLSAGAWEPSPGAWPAERYVVDASVAGAYGGTGATTDWANAGRLAGQYPVMLAGGLSPENVEEAVRAVRPMGVDVASGVECSPGKKDHRKLRAFIERARNVVVRGNRLE